MFVGKVSWRATLSCFLSYIGFRPTCKNRPLKMKKKQKNDNLHQKFSKQQVCTKKTGKTECKANKTKATNCSG